MYGNIVIDSLSDIICRWNVRIQGLEGIGSVEIGVSGDAPSEKYLDTEQLPSNTFLFRTNNREYSLEHVYGSEDCIVSREDGKLHWESDDIVGIQLNLKKRNIEVSVNDMHIGIIFKNIPIGDDIKYRLAICMNNDGQSATIINHRYLIP